MTMPNNPDLTLTTRDQVTLGAALFESTTSNQRAVLINTAMGVKQSYYAEYAAYLAEQGFTVLTYDYRGIGRSKPDVLRGYKANLLNWAVDDQTAAIQYLTQCYPTHKLFVVGHSLGGQIAGLTPEYARVAGWLGVGSQSGYWRGWDGVLQLRMILLWYIVAPALSHLYGYFPASMVGMGNNNIPANVVLDWASAGRKPYYIRSLYSGTLNDHFASVTAPMLLHSLTDDDFAPPRSVEALRALYPNAKTEHNSIAPQDIGVDAIGHFGFFRKQFKDSLWANTAAWLSTQ
jgi:predicted alpha/beta hydrolase